MQKREWVQKCDVEELKLLTPNVERGVCAAEEQIGIS